MDFSTQTWLIVVVSLLIVGIFLDGFRRMRKARNDSLRMSLDIKKQSSEKPDPESDRYGSEFPNGGARVSEREIDKERIAKARSQYDFGADLTSILKPKQKNKSSSDEAEEIDDQWVDSDPGDEEYYGKTWDDEYDFDDEMDGDADIEQDSVPVNDNKELKISAEVEEDFIVDAKETIEEFSAELVGEERDLSIDDEPVVVNKEPEQVSLNLEETVPVLMEPAEAEVSSKNATKDKSAKVKPHSDHDVLLDDNSSDELEIRPVGKRIKKAIEPTIGDGEDLDKRSANKPRYQSKYFSRETKQTTEASPSLQEVLIIHVKASGEEYFSGSDILQQAVDNGLRYGAMDIFHYHIDEDGEGPVLFSMANMLMPGVFDLKTMDTFSTVGVTFFLTLPVAENENMTAFDTMIETAKNIAAGLGGELKDEQRSVMTAQTIEHYRERVRDFARRQQLEKNKP